jgi:hypothetical protein
MYYNILFSISNSCIAIEQVFSRNVNISMQESVFSSKNIKQNTGQQYLKQFVLLGVHQLNNCKSSRGIAVGCHNPRTEHIPEAVGSQLLLL